MSDICSEYELMLQGRECNRHSVHLTVAKFENIRHSDTFRQDMCAKKVYTQGIVQNRVELFECRNRDFQRSVSEDVLSRRRVSVDSDRAETADGLLGIEDMKKRGDNAKLIVSNSLVEETSQLGESKSGRQLGDKSLRRSRRNRSIFEFKSLNKDAVSSKVVKTVNTKKEVCVGKEESSKSTDNKQALRETKSKVNCSSVNKSRHLLRKKSNTDVSASKIVAVNKKFPECEKLAREEAAVCDNETDKLKLVTHALNQISIVVQETSPEVMEFVRPLSVEEVKDNQHIVENITKCYLEQMKQLYLNNASGRSKDQVKRENSSSTLNQQAVSSQTQIIQDTGQTVEAEEDIKIYRDENSGHDVLDEEFGYSSLTKEESIVEAYNIQDAELVISNLQIDHQEIVEPIRESTEEHVIDDEPALRAPKFCNIEENTRQTSVNSTLTELASCSVSSSSNRGSYELNYENGDLHTNKKEILPGEHRETFYDNNENPRIEKVIVVNGNGTSVTSHLERKDFIIDELLVTEENYIKDLEKVVLIYKPFIVNQTPIDLPHLQGKEYYLFGNIEDILRESIKFLEDLKMCNNSHEEIAKAFINHRKLFQLYPFYSKNKPYADKYMLEFRPIIKMKQYEIKDKLDLASYLLTPIQRLGKYILLLQKISNELIKEGIHSTYVQTALDLVKNSMSRGNDYLAIDSIRHCSINLTLYGSFIMTDKFMMLKPRKYECSVFLFDDIVVFTQAEGKTSESHLYVDSIKMNDLSIVTFDTQPLIIHLKDYTRCKNGHTEQFTFILEAKSIKVKQTWQDQIEKKLWEQLTKCKEQVLETYNNSVDTVSLPSRKSSPKNNSVRSKTLPKNSKFSHSKLHSRFYVPLN